jgi:hypothetical protein
VGKGACSIQGSRATLGRSIYYLSYYYYLTYFSPEDKVPLPRGVLLKLEVGRDGRESGRSESIQPQSNRGFDR